MRFIDISENEVATMWLTLREIHTLFHLLDRVVEKKQYKNLYERDLRFKLYRLRHEAMTELERKKNLAEETDGKD